MADQPTIRPSAASELEAIRQLAVRAGLFTADEAADVITDVAVGDGGAALWLSAVTGSAVVGALYAAAEPVSDAVWNMYFLAVDPSWHGTGVGSALVAEAESRLRARPDRTATALVVETSSGAAYSQARGFYAGRGYAQVGQVPHYYGPGEDKVVFWKSLL